MAIEGTTNNSAACYFWDRFIERLNKHGVKQCNARWYVIRAEQYIKAFPDKRLAEHTVEDVNGYLESAGRLYRLKDWQFVQMVDAIRNLLRTAGTALASEVDWEFSCPT